MERSENIREDTRSTLARKKPSWSRSRQPSAEAVLLGACTIFQQSHPSEKHQSWVHAFHQSHVSSTGVFPQNSTTLTTVSLT